MTNPWNNLVSAAISGTERAAAPAAIFGFGASLAAQIDDGVREMAILSRAAIVALSNRAGFQPNTLPEDVVLHLPSDRDSKPVCSQRCADLLGAMLSGTMPELISEWLALANSHGLLISHFILPAIFDVGGRSDNLRPAIAEASGARGRWLAAQNPKWSWVIARQRTEIPNSKLTSEIWETGTVNEREALIMELRRTDPNRALTMIQSTWKADSSDNRVRFMKSLSIGLGIADERFLETSLDDKRKEVREQAQSLLGELPNSQLCLRMQERARGMLQLKKAFLRADSIVVQLPEDCDDLMLRDGMVKNPALRSGFGVKAHWLCEILGYVPMQYWIDTWAMKPAQLIEIAMRCDEWRNAIIQGWNTASRRQRNSEWQEAMLVYFVSSPDKWHDAPYMSYADFSAIPFRRASALLMPFLSRPAGNPASVHPLAQILLRVFADSEEAWDDGLAMQIIRIAVADMRRTGKIGKLEYSELSLLKSASYRSSPKLVELLDELWKGTREQLRPESLTAVNRFLEVMQFRLRMQRAFEEETD